MDKKTDSWQYSISVTQTVQCSSVLLSFDLCVTLMFLSTYLIKQVKDYFHLLKYKFICHIFAEQNK